ncbi:DNA excision repair protein ERCC-6-like 2 [Amphibalanus amphitrite]|uniref:DNA repair and recombination protein RAD54-like n=1 Tax=Amphibalanus amphitrite TaxID=1232801 RepID=A0A6A4WZ74_AMPAM|nr:DNA excision repair protein ERCC-6-like 2 [Amphibalanus amphitrite]
MDSGLDRSDGRSTPPFLRSLETLDVAPPPPPPRPPPVLVICPAAVLYNWLSELNTWGTFDVGLFVRDRRSEVLRASRNRALDVVLSSFEAARDHVTALNGPDWSAVIVDEAHRLKSVTSLVTQALGGLDCRRRIGLSGTVVQFWCLLDWANPGCLGTCEQFVNDFVRPIERGRRRGAVKRDVAESWRRRELLATMRQRWMLRRTKALIADQLPNKTDQIVYCPPSPLQRQVYSAVLDRPDVRLLVRRSRPCDCGSGRRAARCCLKHESGPAAGVALSYMSLLMKVSNHPCLLLPSGSASAQQNRMARQVCQSVFDQFPELARLSRSQAYRALSDPKYCGKMKVLTTLIEHFRQKSQKVLIFSYSTRMLKIIRAYVLNQQFDLTYIDGETPASERPALCEQFCRRPQWAVALVSTRAGGQGLNIVGATAVVVVDPSWNPAHDLQAQDRAYRLGQTKDVSVFRLVTAGTIEENIYLRQVYKQQLSTLAVEGGTGPRLFSASAGRPGLQGELFGLHNLLQLRADGRLTEGLLDSHRRVERLLTAAAGHEVSGALPEVREGVAGLTVSDYTAVAPAGGGEAPSPEGAELLPSDDEVDQTPPGGHREAAVGGAEVTASIDVALRDCGVRHVHGNAPLVAASRLEEHVARQATRAVYQLHAGTQEPAERCAPLPPQRSGSGRGAQRTPRQPPPVPPGGLPRPSDPTPQHSAAIRPSGSRSGRRLPSVLTGEASPAPRGSDESPAGSGRTRGGRRRQDSGRRREESGRRREESGGRQGSSRRRQGSGQRRTRRHRPTVVDQATSTDWEEAGGLTGAVAGDQSGEDAAAPAAEGAVSDHGARTPPTMAAADSDDSVVLATPPRLATPPPVVEIEEDVEHPVPPPISEIGPRSPETVVASSGPSTPKRPRTTAASGGGTAMDAFLDRLLESPVRRPPPSRRPRPRPRPIASVVTEDRQEGDVISRWVRDGKVSIVK